MEILLIHNCENGTDKMFITPRLQTALWIRNETTNAIFFIRNFNVYRNYGQRGMRVMQTWLQSSFLPIFNFKLKRSIRRLEIATFSGILFYQYKKWILRLLVSMLWVLFLLETEKSSNLVLIREKHFYSAPDMFHFQISAATMISRKSFKIDMRILLFILRLSLWDEWNQRIFLSSFFFILNPLLPFWDFFNSYFLPLNWS